MAEGDYELVDNLKFDIETGVSVNSNRAGGNNEDEYDSTFPESSPGDANIFKNRFDEIASGSAGTSRRAAGFKNKIKRNKKLFIFLGVVVLFWVVGIAVYSSGSSSSILDYYKSKIGTTGEADPEVDNNKAHDSAPQPQPQPATVEEKPEEYTDNEPEYPAKDKEEAVAESPSSDDEPKEKSTPSSKKKKITMDEIRSGKFNVYDTNLKFISLPSTLTDYQDEGLYYFADRDAFHAKKSSDASFDVKLNEAYFFQYDSNRYSIHALVPNYDLTFAIVSTNSERLFRHSSLAQYWLYDIKEKKYTPLTDNANDKLSYAFWSPSYNYISIVKDNNIYIKTLKDNSIKQITTDGSDLLFNGRTDWVYEEEVMATDKALWWSPDESSLTYLKTDESDVPNYNIDYYVQTKDGGGTKYPISKKISYPKPGFPNPNVSLFTYDLEKDLTAEIDRSDSELGTEFVVYEVFYVGSKSLIIKETDRESNILNYRHYDVDSQKSKITLAIDASVSYNGWVEKFNDPLIIPPGNGRETFGFVDTVVVDDYNHLVFFETPDSSSPSVLTEGEWEVSNSELSFNKESNTVFFSSNQRSSIDRHVYSVDLESKEIKGLFGAEEPGYYDSHFSADGKYISLNYQGPDTPYQKLYSTSSTSNELQVLSDSTLLTMAMNQYELPTKSFHRVKVDENEDGSPVELNVVEILPANFDKSKKHPLLVHFYAGPGSQVVNSAFRVDFEESIASSLDAVVLFIEPRGTAGQGWRFRSWANNKIGYWEPRDIVKVTEQWLENDFIDKQRTAVWGWSYGGFTTLKTLEYDGGNIFKYGMAVAPVTNWLFYDSIYTERYMNKPENNEEGYKISQISNVANLQKANRFLIMHGTADDNVHIQNTYSLLDLLDVGNVKNYDVHVFPDSEHSIYYHNANSIVYSKLSSWLKDAFYGDFDDLQHK